MHIFMEMKFPYKITPKERNLLIKENKSIRINNSRTDFSF